eukprot:5212376-Amphidinium_carterae.1
MASSSSGAMPSLSLCCGGCTGLEACPEGASEGSAGGVAVLSMIVSSSVGLQSVSSAVAGKSSLSDAGPRGVAMETTCLQDGALRSGYGRTNRSRVFGLPNALSMQW